MYIYYDGYINIIIYENIFQKFQIHQLSFYCEDKYKKINNILLLRI